MAWLTDEQYQSIKVVAEELLQRNGHIGVEELLSEIDFRVSTGEIPEVFVATIERIYDRYRFEVVHSFIDRWELERGEYWLGVASRASQYKAYYPLDDAPKEPMVAIKAKRQYVTAITMLKTYAPYASSWGQSLEDIYRDIDEIKTYITNNWK